MERAVCVSASEGLARPLQRNDKPQHQLLLHHHLLDVEQVRAVARERLGQRGRDARRVASGEGEKEALLVRDGGGSNRLMASCRSCDAGAIPPRASYARSPRHLGGHPALQRRAQRRADAR